MSLAYVLPLQSKSDKFSTSSMRRRTDYEVTLTSKDIVIGNESVLPQEQL